jgi:hypothetical protein
MSIDNFIPEVWSAEINRVYERSLVYASAGVVNRDYEGEISGAGDTVRINSIGDPTIGDYTKNTDMAAVETLTDAQASLLINQQKFFNFQVDDIDAAQQKPKVMAAAMDRAGFGLRSAVDAYIAVALHRRHRARSVRRAPRRPSPSRSRAGTSRPTSTSSTCRSSSTRRTSPEDGRFAIVPSWFHGLLLKDDRFVAAGATRGDHGPDERARSARAPT